MAASTSNQYPTSFGIDAPLFPVYTNTHIYANVQCAVNSSGYLVQVSDTSGLLPVGTSLEEVNNGTGASGALSCPVVPIGQGDVNGWFVFNCSGATQAWVGTLVYFTDDVTVAQSSSHSIVAGVVTQFISSTQVVVDMTRRAAV